jgi:hypothetical protein
MYSVRISSELPATVKKARVFYQAPCEFRVRIEVEHDRCMRRPCHTITDRIIERMEDAEFIEFLNPLKMSSLVSRCFYLPGGGGG